MAVITKEFLSGTTNGRPFEILASAVTVHTPHATAKDEVWLWVANTTSTPQSVSVYIDDGSVDTPDDYYVKDLVIPPNSPRMLILEGQPMNVATNVLKAIASAAAALTFSGFVNRYTT